jgi:4-hydroxy-tetrahydrodipicolinate reductase
MTIKVIMAGATGWVGKALIPAIAAQTDMALVGAVSRNAAGQDSGVIAGGQENGVVVSGTLADALSSASDVVVDYTKPNIVKAHALEAVSKGRHMVIGTSGLGAADYAEIDKAARANDVGVLAAGNFSITATLMKRFALMAAKYVPDVEVIDYASAGKADAPSGTARELAEMLAEIRQPATALPVSDVSGVPETRGAAVGAGTGVQVHAVRLPSYILSCEALFGLPDERLTIRHDAGSSAAPYVAGTLLAIRRVSEFRGLVRGLDALMD